MRTKVFTLVSLRSGLVGLLIFLVSTLIVYFPFHLTENFLFSSLLIGLVSGVSISKFFHLEDKMIYVVLTVLIALPLSTIIAFGLIEGTCVIIPIVCNIFGETGIPDILAILIMAACANVLFSLLIFKRKAWLRTLIIGTIVEIPSSICVVLFNLYLYDSSWYIRLAAQIGYIDFNYLFIVMGIGFGLGVNIHLLKDF